MDLDERKISQAVAVAGIVYLIYRGLRAMVRNPGKTAIGVGICVILAMFGGSSLSNVGSALILVGFFFATLFSIAGLISRTSYGVAWGLPGIMVTIILFNWMYNKSPSTTPMVVPTNHLDWFHWVLLHRWLLMGIIVAGLFVCGAISKYIGQYAGQIAPPAPEPYGQTPYQPQHQPMQRPTKTLFQSLFTKW